ncbi:MAG: hypothetical protein AB7I19_13470 [Planctomycetota bacterium]
MRRSVDHGSFERARLRSTQLPDLPTALTQWAQGEAVVLPGLCADLVREQRAAIDATCLAFDRFREGDEFLDDLDGRLADSEFFRYAGSTIDRSDLREIEKVFIDVPGDRDHRRVRDLTVRLSWIAHDESDLSMRIRVSFGHDAAADWLREDPRASWSERLAVELYPEHAALREHAGLREWLTALRPTGVRTCELIVYSNAPGGGAFFHHDGDPGQRGVAYVQLRGETVWLTAPAHDLAAMLAETTGHAVEEILARMQQLDGDEELIAALNTDPALTRALTERGCAHLLEAGDAILLPSLETASPCWHSVFGIGARPSLAHSMALYDPLPEPLLDARLRAR